MEGVINIYYIIDINNAHTILISTIHIIDINNAIVDMLISSIGIVDINNYVINVNSAFHKK